MKRFKFGGKLGKVTVEMELKRGANDLVVLLHGAYGYPFHIGETRYQVLAKLLSEKYSVAYYETSRKFRWSERPELSFDKYGQLAFQGKKFMDEYNEVEKAINLIVAEVNKNKKIDRLILVGFSLGGIMSILLSHKVTPITDIFTFGTAATFSIPDSWPLFDSYVSVKKIQTILSKFTGNFHMVYGGKDDLSSVDEVMALFEVAKKAKSRSMRILANVDHRFKTFNGIEAEMKLNSYIYEYINHYLSMIQIGL